VNYLLDTHGFLWTAFDVQRLSPLARRTVESPGNSIHVSSVTFWEISLKFALGKLDLTNCVPESLPDVARQMGFVLTSLDAETAASFHRLPRTAHRDPFDRLLVWQAIQTGMILISKDTRVSEYAEHGLKTLW